jgi:hypothetical protein
MRLVLASLPFVAIAVGCSGPADRGEDHGSSTQPLIITHGPNPPRSPSTITRYDVQFKGLEICADVSLASGVWSASLTFGPQVPQFCSFQWLGTGDPDVMGLYDSFTGDVHLYGADVCANGCLSTPSGTVAYFDSDAGNPDDPDSGQSEGSVACAACVQIGVTSGGIGYVVLSSDQVAQASSGLTIYVGKTQTMSVIPPANTQAFTVALPDGISQRPANLYMGKGVTGVF